MKSIYSRAEVRRRFLNNGYSEIKLENGCYCIMYKSTDDGIKVVAMFGSAYPYSNIYDCEAVTHAALAGTRAENADNIDILYVVDVSSGGGLHFLGKNIIKISNNGKSINTLGVSNVFKDEIDIIKDIRGYHYHTNSMDKIINPDNYRHSKLPLYMLIVIMCYCFFRYCLFRTTNSLGYSAEGVLNGEWYKMFTYMFAHANIAHLIGNMSALLVMGSLVMEIEGFIPFSFIFFTSGFAAAFIDCYISILTGTGTSTVTVGASGAIFSIMGALVIETFTDRAMETRRVNVVKAVVLCLILSNIGARVNVRVHITGFIVGALLTLVYDLIKNKIRVERLKSLRHEGYTKYEYKKPSPILQYKIETDPLDNTYDAINRLQERRNECYYQ